jgi:hypothetical protein
MQNGHFFSEPINDPVTVTTYEARYASSFRPVSPELTVSRLHEAVLRPSDQMSIKELDPSHLEPFLDNNAFALLRRTGIPDSCSFNIPMICASVKRLRFMFWSSRWAKTNFNMD